MSKRPTVYMRDEDYAYLESNFETIAKGVRQAVETQRSIEEEVRELRAEAAYLDNFVADPEDVKTDREAVEA